MRLASGALAVASVVPLWFGSFLALLAIAVSAQRPDPSIPDGDPCCGHPDTWAEVAGGLVYGFATVAGIFALAYVAVALARFALRNRTPHRGRLGVCAALLAAWGVVELLAVEFG